MLVGSIFEVKHLFGMKIKTAVKRKKQSWVPRTRISGGEDLLMLTPIKTLGSNSRVHPVTKTSQASQEKFHRRQSQDVGSWATYQN